MVAKPVHPHYLPRHSLLPVPTPRVIVYPLREAIVANSITKDSKTQCQVDWPVGFKIAEYYLLILPWSPRDGSNSSRRAC